LKFVHVFVCVQACMARVLWYRENMEEKNSSILFRGSNWAKTCNLLRMLIIIRTKENKLR